MYETIDVHNKRSGKIWQKTPALNNECCLANIINRVKPAEGESSTKGQRTIRILHCAFNRTATELVTVDQTGGVTLFQLTVNKYKRVVKLPSSVTALVFDTKFPKLLVCATTDCNLRCLDISKKEPRLQTLSTSKVAHLYSISAISTHSSGQYVVSSSADTAFVWEVTETEGLKRRRHLTIEPGMELSQVVFLPESNHVVACFHDNSIVSWDVEIFKQILKIKPISGLPSGAFKHIVASRDGLTLAAGGRSGLVALYSTIPPSKDHLQKIIDLSAKIQQVKQLCFAKVTRSSAERTSLFVLGQKGILILVDISSCQQMLILGSGLHTASPEPPIAHFALSVHDARLAVCSSDHIGACRLLDLEALLTPSVLQMHADAYGRLQRNAASSRSAQLPVTKLVYEDGRPEAQTTPKKQRHSPRKAKAGGDQGGQTSKRLFDTLPYEAPARYATKETTSLQQISRQVDMKALRRLVRHHGRLPDKHRDFAWRLLLRLPDNHVPFATLLSRGTHPAYTDLLAVYPVRSNRYARSLQRVLSALAHWSEMFAETEWLPQFVFPFAVTFASNLLACFEIVASVLLNWARHWWEFWPHPPINALARVENLLLWADPLLVKHLTKLNVTAQQYAWPLMSTAFSETLPAPVWRRVWDHLLVNPPGFLSCIVAAFSIVSRGAILAVDSGDHVDALFHHASPVDADTLLSAAYRLQQRAPAKINPLHIDEATGEHTFVPLPLGAYPAFDHYPKFIVDFHSRERRRISGEESDYLSRRDDLGQIVNRLETVDLATTAQAVLESSTRGRSARPSGSRSASSSPRKRSPTKTQLKSMDEAAFRRVLLEQRKDDEVDGLRDKLKRYRDGSSPKNRTARIWATSTDEEGNGGGAEKKRTRARSVTPPQTVAATNARVEAAFDRLLKEHKHLEQKVTSLTQELETQRLRPSYQVWPTTPQSKGVFEKAGVKTRMSKSPKKVQIMSDTSISGIEKVADEKCATEHADNSVKRVNVLNKPPLSSGSVPSSFQPKFRSSSVTDSDTSFASRGGLSDVEKRIVEDVKRMREQLVQQRKKFPSSTSS